MDKLIEKYIRSGQNTRKGATQSHGSKAGVPPLRLPGYRVRDGIQKKTNYSPAYGQ